MTYAEFLKSQGATAEDIAVLDTPVARKAFEAQQKAASDASAAKADADAKLAAYDKWYQEVANPSAERALQEAAAARADAEAERARTKSLQEAGLIKMRDQDDAAKAAAAAAAGQPTAPDLRNYVDKDTLTRVAEAEGDAIAAMQDIADEHRELFGTRINAKELRALAKEQRKTLEQVWLDKFNVVAKRAEKAAADKTAYETKIATEAVNKYRSENENPLTRTPVASNHPAFAKRTADGKGDVLPWQNGNASNDRVNRALSSLQQKSVI